MMKKQKLISSDTILNQLNQGIAYCRFLDSRPLAIENLVFEYYNAVFAQYFDVPENTSKAVDYTNFNVSEKIVTRFIENAIVAVTTQITQQVFYYSDRFAGHFQMVFIPYDARSFIVSFNDVTVQFLKATEKEVLLSAINNIIVEYDEDLVILNIYDGDSSMFYLPKSKVIGKKITDLFPSEFARASINSLLKAKATNKVQQLVLPSPIPFDDRIFLYQHQYVSVNNHHRFLTTGMDITKEVRINEQLKAQSEQLEKFFSVNVDMLAIIDRFGKFVRVNKVWESILEYPISDLVDASIYDFMHPDDVAFTQKQIQRLDQHEIVHEFINRFKTKSGAYRYFEWRASFGDDYLYGAARDITDQKNLQKKLQYQVDLFEIAIEGSDTGVWEYNLERNSIYFSKRWKLMLGYEDDELENNFNNFVNLVYQADRDFVLSQRDLLESGQLRKYDIEFRMYHKDGSPIWVRSKAHGVYDDQGKLLRMVGSHENITKAKEDNLALVQTFNRMQELSKQGRIIMWDIDALGTIQYVNSMFETVLGYDRESVLHTKIYDYFIAKSTRTYQNDMQLALKTQKKLRGIELQMRKANDETVWVLVNANPHFDNHNQFIGYQGSLVDIDHIKRSQQALAQSEEKYRLLTENLSDVLWIYDVNTQKIIYASRSIVKLTGFDVENRKNTPLKGWMVATSFSHLRNMFEHALKKYKHNPLNQEPQLCDIELYKADGSTTWLELSFTFRTSYGDRLEAIGVGRDIQDRKLMEQRLEYVSYHDGLTGLYNRSYYEQELKRLNVQRSLPMSIILADINDLKLTNDTFGHMEGDRLIQTFATILKKTTRAEDIVARIGGDEFVILLPNTNEQEVIQIVNRINEFVKKEISTKIKLSAAIGYMTTNEIVDSIDKIFVIAEEAMYHQKLRDKQKQQADILNIIEVSYRERFPEQYLMSMAMVDCVKKMLATQNVSLQKETDILYATQFALVGLLSDERLSLTYEKHRIAEHGYHILKNVPAFRDVADYVLAIFENGDGSGKPHGLRSADIPLASKMIRVALDYHILLSQGLRQKSILKKLVKNVNIVYDKEVLDLLIQATKEKQDEKIRS